MPSTRSSSFSRPLPSSTVITPSLPTLSIASAIVLPIDSSALAEIAPTCAISLLVVHGLLIFFSSSTTAITALSMPRFRSIGFMPAATYFMPSLHDRLREHGGGRGAVTGDVGGLGRDFLHHLRAHVLELVLQLDFLRDRHAVLGDGRRAEAALEHDVAALGAEGDLDGVGEDVHAGHHLVACALAEADVFGCHGFVSPGACSGCGEWGVSRRCR